MIATPAVADEIVRVCRATRSVSNQVFGYPKSGTSASRAAWPS